MSDSQKLLDGLRDAHKPPVNCGNCPMHRWREPSPSEYYDYCSINSEQILNIGTRPIWCPLGK